ncbi:MAG: hypothetical protein KME17_29420 [Cyanosarcina radialis HA8281-LM2]|jgi:hypothetical protein|nr:hypothetical protein [Cyanosarcina radialis HA8281-LM2]
MRRRITFILGLIVLTAVTILSIAIWWPIDDSRCDADAFLASNMEKYQVQAIKVVAKPWLGAHKIYAIFMVDDRYRKPPFFVLSVKDAGNYCEVPYGYQQTIDGISAAPGTHLIQDWIRTRTAIQLIVTGKYDRLKDKHNWLLTYPKDLQEAGSIKNWR